MISSRPFALLAAALFTWAVPAALGAAPADNVAAVPAPGACISTAHSCVSVPVVFTRADATPVRGYSVTYHFSANLSQCAAPAAGTYLSSVNSSTTFEVTDNGDGSFTVDEVMLGAPCGATGSATLFTISVATTDTAGTGQIIVDDVVARDCSNVPVAGAPGDTASINIDKMPTLPVGDLTAVQQLAGNDTDGTTKVGIGLSVPVDAVQVKVYRAGYGDYPEFATGTVPASPSYPPGAPWTLTAVNGSGQSDEPSARDYYYYVVFTLDSCDNVSLVSNRAGGVLNYHNGDVTPGSGDNAVTLADVSLLGTHYGLKGAVNVDPFNTLDVGPTVGGSVSGRPAPDDKLGFEDLILMAVNYGGVSKPASSLAFASAVDRMSLETTEGPAGSDLAASLRFSGTGRLHGITTRLAWNAGVVEPLAAAQGALLELNQGLMFSDAPGNVDAAVLGKGSGFAGEGVLATVAFRRIAPGEAGIRLAAAEGRDIENQRVDLAGRGIPAVHVNALRAASPNPFRSGTALAYSLATRGAASLSVHSVDGRLLRTLVSGTGEAGEHRATWDGADANGHRMAPGVYYVRLRTGGESLSRAVTLLR